MSDFINSEFSRLFKSKAIFIFLAFICTYFLMTLYFEKSLFIQFIQEEDYSLWHFSVLNNYLIFAIMYIVFVFNDFTERYITNFLIQGYKRIEIYFGKLLIYLFVFSICFLTIVILEILFGNVDINIDIIGRILLVYILCLSACAMFYSLFFIFSCILNNYVYFVMLIIGLSIMNLYIIDLFASIAKVIGLKRRMVESMNLFNYPFLFSDMDMTLTELLPNISWCLIFISIFILIGLYLFKKIDFK